MIIACVQLIISILYSLFLSKRSALYIALQIYVFTFLYALSYPLRYILVLGIDQTLLGGINSGLNTGLGTFSQALNLSFVLYLTLISTLYLVGRYVFPGRRFCLFLLKNSTGNIVQHLFERALLVAIICLLIAQVCFSLRIGLAGRFPPELPLKLTGILILSRDILCPLLLWYIPSNLSLINNPRLTFIYTLFFCLLFSAHVSVLSGIRGFYVYVVLPALIAFLISSKYLAKNPSGFFMYKPSLRIPKLVVKRSSLLVLIPLLMSIPIYFLSSMQRGSSDIYTSLSYALSRSTGLIELSAAHQTIPSFQLLYDFLFKPDRSHILNIIFSTDLSLYVGDGDFAARTLGFFGTSIIGGTVFAIPFTVVSSFVLCFFTHSIFKYCSTSHLFFSISTVIYIDYLFWEFPPDRIFSVPILIFLFALINRNSLNQFA